MKGTKRITDLITSPDALKAGRINIIEAPVSSGKTRFALEVIPEWAGTPEKVLYLIDTTNGDLSIQQNIIAVSRQIYALWNYNTKHIWGETDTDEKMPVMTYAGFGKEVQTHGGTFHWLSNFEYIICDEMQNLVNYRSFKSGDKANIIAAEVALRMIAAEGKTKIVALSATPQKIREQFKELCYDVPMDRRDIVQLETFAEIPYNCGFKDILENGILRKPKFHTGIIYTTEIDDMREIIAFARGKGIHANGFWSIHATKKMSPEQLTLRQTVLDDETIPDDIDLLVINASSETCIKIQGEKRKVDYMIIHNSNKEVITQVRGRYNGDLLCLYYHDIEAANIHNCRNLPERFLNVRLCIEGQEELCAYLKLRDPKAKDSEYYKMRKVREYLEKCGYNVEYKKDSKNSGKHYYVISR